MRRDTITTTDADGTIRTVPVNWHFATRPTYASDGLIRNTTGILKNASQSRQDARTAQKPAQADKSTAEIMDEIREGLAE